MTNHIIVLRHGFQFFTNRESKLKDELLLDLRDNLPVLIGFLHSQSRSELGVSLKEIWEFGAFRRLTTLNSVRKTVDRYISRLQQTTLAGGRGILTISRGVGEARNQYRLSVAKGTRLALSDEMQLIINENIVDKTQNWRSLAEHDVYQLEKFGMTIYKAAAQFDTGQLPEAESELMNGLKEIREPTYKAVILMRLARASFRIGNEKDAERHLSLATKLVESMPKPDAVLVARATYNRAWFAYVKGDFSYNRISLAQRELANAGPDDIRHANVSSLHGLVVVKDIERNHSRMTQHSLAIKVYEALRYLYHGIYLFIRSEDFWGAQEACWNLAYALYRIGNIKSIEVPETRGFVGRDNDQIIRWITLSEAISGKHDTGYDSLRIHVLKGSVFMTRYGDLDKADEYFRAAEKIVESTERHTTPRESGRLFERRIEFYLKKIEQNSENDKEFIRLTNESFERAQKFWKKAGLEDLLRNELYAKYRKKDGRIVRGKSGSIVSVT